jgi:hypothetical protein
LTTKVSAKQKRSAEFADTLRPSNLFFTSRVKSRKVSLLADW